MRNSFPNARWRRLLVVAALAVLGVFLASTPSAFADTPPSTPTPAAPTKEVTACKTVVERVAPDSSETRVVSHTCSQVSASQVKAQKQLVAPNASVLLVTLYEDINESGYYDDIYGSSGPCDALGYSLSDLTYSNAAVGGVSAFTTYNNCSGQRYYHDTGFTNYCGVNTGYYLDWVGNYCNDHLLSMKVYKFY